MFKHNFIFLPGIWIGEGRVTFSESPEHLRFYTKWIIEKSDEENVIHCQHQVEMQGSDENVSNKFSFFNVTPNSFAVKLENNLIGEVSGKGIIDAKTIAWEFKGSPEFEGFEVYELQEDGDYMLHAEYASSDQYRTIVDGRIWKKST